MRDFRLFFLRHGETRLNREHRMQGQGSDHALSERGRRQYELVAERLADEGITAIFTSDLRRAAESAEILAARVGIPVISDPRLREQDLGEWEGWSWPDLASLASQEALDGFLGDLGFAPPGGERKGELLERVSECLLEIVKRHPGETVAVVSHGGPLVVFLYHALDIPFDPRNRLYGSNAGVTEFERVGGRWRLITFDETHFLSALDPAQEEPPALL